MASLRALNRAYGTIGGGIVLRECRFVALLHVGLSPLRGWTRALMCSAISSGVRIVGLANALAAVGCRSGSAARIRAGVGIVLRGMRR